MGAGAVGNKNNTVMIKTKQNKTLLSFVEWEIKTVGGFCGASASRASGNP